MSCPSFLHSLHVFPFFSLFYFSSIHLYSTCSFSHQRAYFWSLDRFSPAFCPITMTSLGSSKLKSFQGFCGYVLDRRHVKNRLSETKQDDLPRRYLFCSPSEIKVSPIRRKYNRINIWTDRMWVIGSGCCLHGKCFAWSNLTSCGSALVWNRSTRDGRWKFNYTWVSRSCCSNGRTEEWKFINCVFFYS